MTGAAPDPTKRVNGEEMDQYARAGRLVAAALRYFATLPTEGPPPDGPSARELMLDLGDALRATLSPRECLALAFATAASTKLEDLEELLDFLRRHICAGPPRPPFEDVQAEARDWAAWASPAELRAYIAAIWHRLTDRARGSFLRAVRPKKGDRA